MSEQPESTNSGDFPSHETHFHGSVTGPVHTGAGDINVSTPLVSLKHVQESLDGIFRWSEADEHMRSGWAGMVIWSLTAVTDRLTPRSWFIFFVAVALWIATAWLITPVLQWPLDDPQVRLIAAGKFALASWLIPLFIALLTPADRQANFELTAKKQRFTLFLLKITGALVGFTVFAAVLFVPALVLHYLQFSTFPLWLWSILSLLPLAFSHISARRIPADRYKMFGSRPQLHAADKLFLVVFLFVGPALAAFVTIWYDLLADRLFGFILLLALVGVALWEQRKREPTLLSDPQLILAIGLLLPLLAFLLIFFVSDQTVFDSLPTLEQFWSIALAASYLIGPFILWIVLQIRNRPVLTLSGVFALLFVLLLLNGVLRIHLPVGRLLTLAVVGLWLLWGRKRFRQYLWVHSSMAIMLILVGLSLYLAVGTAVPLYANTLGFLIVTGLLIFWAYRSSSPTILDS
ncbi:MAG: hypothetical protein KC419_00195 [Anaerolineales bacterium]|nr:hypothetical protein [Anaerolineales bacterium]